MAVADEDGVHERQLRQVAGRVGESLEILEVDWGAMVFEDGIEEYSQPGRELDVITGVAQPGSSEFRRGSARGQEIRSHDRYDMIFRFGGWPGLLTCSSMPNIPRKLVRLLGMATTYTM